MAQHPDSSNFGDLNQALSEFMNERNNHPVNDFEGYSPAEMHYILWDPFGPDCPVQLNQLTNETYGQIPLLNQIIYLGKMIESAGVLKLTQRGYLPPAVIHEIYNQGFIRDESIESGLIKLNKESDSMVITLTAILITLAGIAKKRYNKLSLTKSGKVLLACKSELLKNLLLTFGQKFNWSYFDGYGSNNIGQLGYAFSLILLKKYGAEPRLGSFYAEKYFRAFPKLISQPVTPRFGTPEDLYFRCYTLRTFERFLDYFGLIQIQKSTPYLSPITISKTPLFDKLISLRSHIPNLTTIQKS